MKTRPGTPSYNPPGTPGAPASTILAVDPTLGSVSDLANVVTLGTLFPPAIKVWINSDTGALEVWKLMASTAATGAGVQRPADYSVSNQVVWFKASS